MGLPPAAKVGREGGKRRRRQKGRRIEKKGGGGRSKRRKDYAESKHTESWLALPAREGQAFILRGRTLSAKQGPRMGVVLRGN